MIVIFDQKINDCDPLFIFSPIFVADFFRVNYIDLMKLHWSLFESIFEIEYFKNSFMYKTRNIFYLETFFLV